jgi:hypothetical protein
MPELIWQYEERRRLTDDPKIIGRAARQITDLLAQLAEYDAESRELGCA